MPGIKIIKYLDASSNDRFIQCWQEDGILGIGFVGHGSSVKDSEGKDEWLGFESDPTSDMGVVGSAEVSPKYKLRYIFALSCGSIESNWYTHLSQKGEFYGYSGGVSYITEPFKFTRLTY